MNSNSRLFIIVALIVVGCIGGLYLTLGGESKPLPDSTPTEPLPPPESSTQSPAKVAATDETPEPDIDPPVFAEEEEQEENSEKTARRGRGSINITVLSEDGTPAPDATLDILLINWKANERLPEDMLRRSLFVDNEGKCSVKRLPIGKYTLIARNKAGGAGHTIDITRQKLSHDCTMKLLATGIGEAVRGDVVDADGDAVVGAIVCIVAMESQAGHWAAMPHINVAATQVATDEHGEFELIPISPTTSFRAMATADGFAPGFCDDVRGGDEGVRIVLKTGGTISGWVEMKDSGDPVEGMQVLLNGEYVYETLIDVTNGDGAFLFEGVRGFENYRIKVDNTDLMIDNASFFPLADGESRTDMLLQLVAAGIISGRVYDVDTGEGIPDVGIQGTERDVKTDSSGYYRITGLAAKPYTIRRSHAKGYPNSWQVMQYDVKTAYVKAGLECENIDFPLSRGLVASGYVLDEAGAGLKDVYIHARSNDMRSTTETQTETDGSFELVGVPASGQLSLTGSKDGYTRQNVGPITIDGENIEGIEIILRTESSISGIVVDPNGSPVPGASVSASGQSGSSGFAKSKADG